MNANEPTRPIFLTARWLVALVVVLAGAGVLIAALVSDDEVDPAELHKENQENSRLGAEEDVEEALEAAAVAQESYYLSNERYAESAADLTAEGLRSAPGVLLNKVIVGPESYCMEAQHDRLPGETFSYFSDKGEVLREPCPF